MKLCMGKCESAPSASEIIRAGRCGRVGFLIEQEARSLVISRFLCYRISSEYRKFNFSEISCS